VILVRSTGLLKLAVVSNDRTETIISFGQCGPRP
jgi:hypothetical protein